MAEHREVALDVSAVVDETTFPPRRVSLPVDASFAQVLHHVFALDSFVKATVSRGGSAASQNYTNANATLETALSELDAKSAASASSVAAAANSKQRKASSAAGAGKQNSDAPAADLQIVFHLTEGIKACPCIGCPHLFLKRTSERACHVRAVPRSPLRPSELLLLQVCHKEGRRIAPSEVLRVRATAPHDCESNRCSHRLCRSANR